MRNAQGNGTVVIVMGYGVHRTPTVTAYLDKVIAFAQGTTTNIVAIITTGGYTSPNAAPSISEAGMMADYLEQQTRDLAFPLLRANADTNYEGSAIPILAHDAAITSAGNLWGVAEMIQKQSLDASNHVISCDGSKAFLISFLARRILGKKPRLITHEMFSGRKKLKMRFVATPLQLAAFYIPWLGKQEKERRERINITRMLAIPLATAGLAARFVSEVLSRFSTSIFRS